jgi:hypothetical protein
VREGEIIRSTRYADLCRPVSTRPNAGVHGSTRSDDRRKATQEVLFSRPAGFVRLQVVNGVHDWSAGQPNSEQ